MRGRKELRGWGIWGRRGEGCMGDEGEGGGGGYRVWIEPMKRIKRPIKFLVFAKTLALIQPQGEREKKHRIRKVDTYIILIFRI